MNSNKPINLPLEALSLHCCGMIFRLLYLLLPTTSQNNPANIYSTPKMAEWENIITQWS